jgi:hypothetical protein
MAPKVLGIDIMCYLPQNAYFLYIDRAFSKIHLAVPACCAGLYTEQFSKGHRALHTYYALQGHLLTSKNNCKFIYLNFRLHKFILII